MKMDYMSINCLDVYFPYGLLVHCRYDRLDVQWGVQCTSWMQRFLPLKTD